MSNGRGTCGFCGAGDGWLGEGDDGSQILHSAVRTGDSPDSWQYSKHPNAWDSDDQYITWCGHCEDGLAHKFQRYDDVNLHAAIVSAQVRFELDGIRWSNWEDHNVAKPPMNHRDDGGIHLDKLLLKRDLDDMERERIRRAQTRHKGE